MLIDTNRLEEAEQFLQTRKSRFENNAGVRQTLGHIAMMKQDHKLAAEYFQEAKLLAPDDAAIVEDLVRAHTSIEKYADAEYNLNKLLKQETYKTRRDLMHMRGRCLVKLDRMLDAREVYIKLTSGSEGTADTEAWIGLGNVSYMLKDNWRVRRPRQPRDCDGSQPPRWLHASRLRTHGPHSRSQRRIGESAEGDFDSL